uniref:DUF7799 domain-containing protein n=1 Tax=Plectus sambesii TaxID=2011161 RepID=A0A914XRR6_9BILA
MTEVKRATTTISTIAIRAGEATRIVVAVLKSVNWVQLRIDEMHPRMLDIGRSANDTARLLDIHSDLMERLKSKQEQIEELLAQADRLVTEQQEPEVAVYEAMADSLGSAWKDLNRQLQLRGNLLEETLRFYELSNQHEHVVKHLNGKLTSGVPTYGTADDMRRFAAEFEQARKDLIDVTALAMDSGASIIGQTRVLGMMVDNPERPREIVDTCLVIEEVMLRLAEQWKTTELSWEVEQAKVGAKEETEPLWRDLEAVDRWLTTAQQEIIRLSAGAEVSQASQQFDHLFTDAKQQQSTLRRVSQASERLIGNAESGQLTDRCVNLKRRFDEFLRDLETRRKNALEVTQFFQSSNV